MCVYNKIHKLFLGKWLFFLCLQVKGVMISLIEGQGNQSTDAYVELLLGETNLKGKSLLVVEDMVMMAVKGGNDLFSSFKVLSSSLYSLQYCDDLPLLFIPSFRKL